ncbi:GATA zinc finger domain-containing protein 8-like [Oppia nitens]|uniref:GATA zinc finger domain-containing protein 8-like n=1 Tax=Oppia nitens TaxID=1686743 RepID=UPI0023DB6F32|nr:GATA zinc finger domain-containing protein 8-like [Oppia nitens]
MNSIPFLHKFMANTSSSSSSSSSDIHHLNHSSIKQLLNQLVWRKKSSLSSSSSRCHLKKDVIANHNHNNSSRCCSQSLNNICLIMKSEQRSTTTRVHRNQSPATGSCRRSHRNNPNQKSTTINECYTMQTSRVTPVSVSFINRSGGGSGGGAGDDEGLVSMQLMDRVMINDNEFKDFQQLKYSNNSNNNNNNNNSITIEDQQWFYGSTEREMAIEMLNSCPIGSFIIRYSTTKDNCFALTLKVPNDYQMQGIAHYLIQMTHKNAFKIKGFTKEFPTIESLVVHHSIMKELLPCPLLLPSNNINNINNNNIIDNEFEDLLVDIDSDPNYQKVLNTFRKSMSSIC